MAIKSNVDYQINHTVCPKTSYTLSNKSSGQTVLDGNFHLFNQDPFDLSLYVKSDFSDLANKKSWKNNWQLRTHFSNGIVSVN